MCGRADSAEDLVQETFLAAIKSLRSFKGKSSHYTWLYGIMLNKFRAWLRGKKGVVSLQDLARSEGESKGADELVADDAPGAFEQVSRRETARIVRAAIQSLPTHHRSVLALRYLESMSYQEIAEALSCSLGTVKSRVHYALRRVGMELGSSEGLEC